MGEDVRSDIYSLGMLAFFALEGSPYAALANTAREVAGTHLRGLRLPLAAKMSGTDPDVVAMIEKMIEPLRDNRLQSYDEVREHIYSILAGNHQQPTSDKRIQARRDHFFATYGHVVIED
jgi:serine/threonine protein kinase